MMRTESPLAAPILAAALDRVAAGILVFDSRGVIAHANPAFLDLLGYEAKEVLGQELARFVTDNGAGRLQALCKGLTAGQTRADGVSFQHRDGEARELYLSVSRLSDAGDGGAYCVAFCRDFTRDRQMQEFMRHTQRREVIGAMAGGIAHDFNNILSIIIGYTECAAGEVEEGSSAAKDLNQVITAAHRARELVQQILAFTHETEQEKRPVRLDILVKEVVKFLGAALPATVEMKVDIAAVNARISGDATRLHQLLMNLCANAWQAMQESGGRIDVRLVLAGRESMPAELAAAPPHAEYYCLTVSDSGAGMDSETRAHAFEPFFTTRPAGEATGLGLYTVQDIVAEHGGLIHLDSAPGKGTTVSVYLPATGVTAPAKAAPPTAEPAGKERGRVLVVDDEEPIALVLGRMLSKLGFDVLTEHDPRQAAALIARAPAAFALLVTDLTMPHMTGLDLARVMHEQSPGTPIILATGYGETLDRRQTKEAGIGLVLVKPVSRAGLAEAVRALLAGSADG
jgi:PAS domain S-box-containing protein